MIFTLPLILTSQFIQHIILLVLTGVMAIEYVTYRKELTASRAGLFDAEEGARFRIRARERLLLFAAVLVLTMWNISDFFVYFSDPIYYSALHIVVLFLVALLIGWAVQVRFQRAFAWLFGWFAVAVSVHILLDATQLFFDAYFLFDSGAHAALKTMEAILLYGIVIRYLIISDK